jgi:hypothetical protein
MFISETQHGDSYRNRLIKCRFITLEENVWSPQVHSGPCKYYSAGSYVLNLLIINVMLDSSVLCDSSFIKCCFIFE